MLNNRFFPLVLLVLMLGCGSPAPPIPPAPPSPVVTACTDYCKAAAAVGCPRDGDCMSECLSLSELGCESLLINLLECAGPELTSECVPRNDAGKLGCIDPLAAYDDCLPIDFAAPLSSCGASIGQSETPASGCQGRLDCQTVDFSVQCDGMASCTCARNGETVGTCTNLLSSAYLCAPHESCCTQFFLPD